MNTTRPNPLNAFARRAALCLPLSMLLLAGLTGCDGRSTATDGRSSTSTTTTVPAASAASR